MRWKLSFPSLWLAVTGCCMIHVFTSLRALYYHAGGSQSNNNTAHGGDPSSAKQALLKSYVTSSSMGKKTIKSTASTISRNSHDENNKKSSTPVPSFDILSVGSLSQQHLHKAQQETFGSHRAVRYFYAATEKDDSEVDCHRKLQYNTLTRIAVRCRNRNKDQYPVLAKISKNYFTVAKLERKHNPEAWICAQKRPFDGFYNMIKQYYGHQPPPKLYEDEQDEQHQEPQEQRRLSSLSDTKDKSLPDYLVIADDDTWLNMDQLLQFVPHHYPSNGSTPHVVAGCLMFTTFFIEYFSFPYGGFGIILNRKALERMLQPLHCGDFSQVGNGTTTSLNDIPNTWLSDANYETFACWRLAQNGVGERDVYRDGMTIADLMHTYVTIRKYREVKLWKERAGFCMHSDMAWGYFLNYYHIAQQPGEPPVQSLVLATAGDDADVVKKKEKLVASTDWSSIPNRLVGYNETSIARQYATGSERGQCLHSNDPGSETGNQSGNLQCTVDAHICHRITPKHMHSLHDWNRNHFPWNYNHAF